MAVQIKKLVVIKCQPIGQAMKEKHKTLIDPADTCNLSNTDSAAGIPLGLWIMSPTLKIFENYHYVKKIEGKS